MFYAKHLYQFLLLLLVVSACDTRCLKPAGKTITTTRTVANFEHINIGLQCHVHSILQQADTPTPNNSQELTITASKNIIPYIQITDKDKLLNIGTAIPQCDRLTKRKAYLKIPYSQLRSISHSGYDVLESKDTLKSQRLDISANYQGDLRLLVHTDQLHAKLTHIGHINLAGITRYAFIHTSSDWSPPVGFGHFKGKHLQTKTCTVLHQAEGNVEVSVSDTLNATINGVGNIIYYGSPKVINQQGSGSGKLINGEL
ncbi:GIN domain-containing protein [Microscilla marina]|uniref:GIN domain-containing protein n=1 Tax=Microscilla marina TaxID=1027 RepID=UPI000316B424|nr:DUF2807 domain-containing protein [Microscilla marina]